METRTALLIAAGLAPSIGSAEAGPCTAKLDALQAKVDAAVEAAAGQGKFGTESLMATQRRQPTPDSIAAAEAKLGEGGQAEAATKAMASARAADAKGDAAGCAEAIGAIDAALAQ